MRNVEEIFLPNNPKSGFELMTSDSSESFDHEKKLTTITMSGHSTPQTSMVRNMSLKQKHVIISN